jgi:hypothetical protein
MSHSGLHYILIIYFYHFTCKEMPSNIIYIPLGFHMYAVYLQQWISVCMNTKAIEQRKITEELFST